jgi:hypothetical protein
MAAALADFVLESLPASAAAELSEYAMALRHACDASRAPYALTEFGRRFRVLARDPSWFANLLVSDAHLEGYSAWQLWKWSESIVDVRVRESVERHANDEARHSRMFASLLHILFPPACTNDVGVRLAAMSPDLIPNNDRTRPTTEAAVPDDVLRSIAFINTFEAKALVLGRLLEPVLVAYASPADARRVERIARALLSDEVRHISYSARILQRASEQGRSDVVRAALHEAHASLNASTTAELEIM